MSGPAFLRGSSPSSAYATGYSGGQSRADEPEPATPAQHDADQAHTEHAKAAGFVREAKQLATVRPYEWEDKKAALAQRLEAFAASRTTSANASTEGDQLRQQTAAAILEARELIAAAKPPRAVPAVAGEDDLAPKIGTIPCGLRVAFHDGAANAREVWVANADGSGLINVSNDAAYDANPSWSPDGTRLVFQSKRGGRWDLYIVNRDGSGLANLTNTPTADELNPGWSPDGQRPTQRLRDCSQFWRSGPRRCHNSGVAVVLWPVGGPRVHLEHVRRRGWGSLTSSGVVECICRKLPALGLFAVQYRLVRL